MSISTTPSTSKLCCRTTSDSVISTSPLTLNPAPDLQPSPPRPWGLPPPRPCPSPPGPPYPCTQPRTCDLPPPPLVSSRSGALADSCWPHGPPWPHGPLWRPWPPLLSAP